MKTFLLILLLLVNTMAFTVKQLYTPRSMDESAIHNYLALGDSYTIGESILQEDNFPNQLIKLLNEENSQWHPARIVAKTGWTTDELQEGIKEAKKNDLLLPTYDLVSLLIGVNDQYRARPIEEYKPRFESLLQQAIQFAGKKPARVIVISIPDWGITPFANGRDREQITQEIDAYNSVNKKIALENKVQYLNITDWTREAVNDPTLLATDGLHPSGKEYKRWAEKIMAMIRVKTDL